MMPSQGETTADIGVRAPLQGRSEATFERILVASRALFEERRSTAVAVREICAASDVSRSSFYARFSSLESLVLLSYERFADRARGVAEDVATQWRVLRPGNGDFEAFVRFMISEHIRFYDRERPLVQAFRGAEATHPDIASRREALDGQIIRRCFAVTQSYYPGFDAERVVAAVAAEGALLIASARSVMDFADQLGAPESPRLDGGRQLMDQFTDLVVDFVRRAHGADPAGRTQIGA